MKQMTISFNDHTIHFRDHRQMATVGVPTGFVVMDDNSLPVCFDRLKQGADIWVWYSHDFRQIVDYCMKNYTFVRAAGGVVETPQSEVLLIQRAGRWDLPKGMVEKGETLTQAALREVQEETGIEQPSIGDLIAKTYHIYDLYGGWHLKQTSWYRMTTTEKQPTLPQQQEGITAAVWVSHEECLRLLNQSFASLRMVAQKISNLWPKN